MTAYVAFAAFATLALIVASGARLVAQALRSRRERRHEQARTDWADRWIDVVFAGAPEPSGPLAEPAVAALLDLRESLTGEPAETLSKLVHSYGIDTRLVERLRRSRWSDLSERIDVLESLGRARSSTAVPALLIAATDPRRSARLMGIRALTRSVAALRTEAEREAVAADVARVLRNADLSKIALGEAMELLGPAAVPVIAEVFTAPRLWGNEMVQTALDVVGRRGAIRFTDDVLRFASSEQIDIRVAALHALTELEELPVAASVILERAFSDRDARIRIEAARASHLLEAKTAIAHLEDLLTDADWIVRRTAATTLAALGGPGVRTLIATSLVHGDLRARNVATQVLVESRSAAELKLEPEKVG